MPGMQCFSAGPLGLLLRDLRRRACPRVPGTATLMSGDPGGAPLLHSLKRNSVLQERSIILAITAGRDIEPRFVRVARGLPRATSRTVFQGCVGRRLL